MEQILIAVKEKYNLSPNTIIGEILQQKGGRTVCTLVGNEKTYVLKCPDKSRLEENVERDAFILSFLKEARFENCPTLLMTKKDERYIDVDGQFVYILEYLEGKNPDSTVENWSELGRLVAKLHKIENYPYKSSFSFEVEKLKFADIAENLPFKDEYLALANSLPNFDTFPECLIHSDIGLHNSIKKDDGAIILIDWDDAGVRARVLDLGYPLLSQFLTNDHIFEKEKAQAFYRSYSKINPITDEEKVALFEASLFFNLIYIPYGDLQKQWDKIQFALNNKQAILEAAFE